MKRALSLLLALFVFLSALPLTAAASPFQPTAADLLEGLFTGDTEEVKDRTSIGGSFNMHFPDFLWVGDEIWAYYIGSGTGGKMATCLAVSTDRGRTFKKKGVVVTPNPGSGEWDDSMTAFAGVWFDNGTYYLVYEGAGTGNNGAIGLATSTDGVNFTKQGKILDYTRSGIEKVNIGTPDLYKEGNTWYLFYHCYDGRTCQICVATGPDLYRLTRYNNPIIPTVPGRFDSGTTGRRDIIRVGDWYYMVYEVSSDQPYDRANWGHSFARSRNLLDWEPLGSVLYPLQMGGMGHDGPNWLVDGDDVYVYFRDTGNTTTRVKLTSKTPDQTRLTLRTWSAQELADAAAAVGARNRHGQPIFTTVIENGTVSAIASYAGVDDPAVATRKEPYSLYNGDGLDKTKNEKATLVDGLGMTLPQGTYQMQFHQASMFSLGVLRVYYDVVDVNTGEVISELLVNRDMVEETVGYDSNIFEYRTLPFTVDEAHSGHTFHFRVMIFNQTDYTLRSAALKMLVGPDATAPTAVLALIHNVKTLTAADPAGVRAARQKLDGLDPVSRMWVDDDTVQKLAALEATVAQGDALQAQVTALPAAADLTWENARFVTASLERAEQAVAAFTAAQGAAATAALVPDAARLPALRQAHDAAQQLADARPAALKETTALINAVGEITAENFRDKQAPLTAAEQSLEALRATYGDETATQAGAKKLAAARAAYDALLHSAVVFGDVNADGSVNSVDALMALQHSVQLITLSEAAVTAADVNGDRTVNASDALLILQHSVKLIHAFPVENA